MLTQLNRDKIGRQCPLLAEDWLLAQPVEGLLWRNPTLKVGEAAAIYGS